LCLTCRFFTVNQPIGFGRWVFFELKFVRKSLFYVAERGEKAAFSGWKAIQYIGEPEVCVAFLGLKPIQDIVEP